MQSVGAVIVTVTVAVAEPPWPSPIVYVKVTVPTKPAAGVNTTTLPEVVTTPSAAPPAGWVTAVTLSVPPSGSESLASTLMLTGAAPAELAVSSTAIGGTVPTMVRLPSTKVMK
ncbi:MAG: hypothetical protein FD127_2776 [Acidimicrobiaceae bacterium]|nr:MAG: hypothetical protein FD127_2776 [Acidimicrobiaceae bacterium]